ncbi:MarR family winged helix-turn-helix transcriptional regulator [Rhodococcus sp. C26F]
MVRITGLVDSVREMREWALVVATARLERGQRASKSLNQLNAADNRLLWLLTSQGPQTMRQIAEALRLEQSTVNRQVNAALTRGLVERLDHPVNGAKALQATPTGRSMFETELARTMTIFAAGLDALPADVRDDFVRNLGVFAEAYAIAAEQQVQREDPSSPGAHSS